MPNYFSQTARQELSPRILTTKMGSVQLFQGVSSGVKDVKIVLLTEKLHKR